MLSRTTAGTGTSCVALFAFLLLALNARLGFAQEPAADDGDPAAGTQTAERPSASETTEPPLTQDAAVERPKEQTVPTAAPPVVPAPSAEEELPPLFIPYGIIKPEVLVANGVETFGKTTLAAPTAAANPISDPNHDEWVTSFQLQQTRFGIKIGEGRALGGRLEVDFIDPAFAQSSPIQGTRLRLRLAYVSYTPAKKHTLTIGQNWDIFSPLNSLSMNMVGVSFQAGNSAFLRPQIIYTYGGTEGLEISGAVGLLRQNTGPAFNFVEYGMIPTGALRVSYRMGKNWFGVSGIVGSSLTQQNPTKEYNAVFGANLFASVTVTDWLSLLAEGYLSRNGNDMGLLVLSSGISVMDAGGYVSASFTMSPLHQVWVTAGGAVVLNPSEMAIGYTPATMDAPAARSGIAGMEHNVNLRATYILSPMKGLQFYVEPFLFLTRHKLSAADDPEGELANQVAYGGQLGTRYTF